MAPSRARKIQAKANSRDTGYSPTQTKNCRKKNKANKLHFLNSDFTLEDKTLHSQGAFRGFNK